MPELAMKLKESDRARVLQLQKKLAAAIAKSINQ